MGDGMKISKDLLDKRHRSCCSVVAAPVEGVRSEWQLDKRASIAEVDEVFAGAESTCDHLQQKITMFKYLKKKKKMKRRGARAEVSEAAMVSNMPVISVQTKPKRKSAKRGPAAEERGATTVNTTVQADDDGAMPLARRSADPAPAPATRRARPSQLLQRRADGDAAPPLVRVVESVCGAEHTRVGRAAADRGAVRGATEGAGVDVAPHTPRRQLRAAAQRDHRQVSGVGDSRAVVELFSRCASPASTVVVSAGAPLHPDPAPAPHADREAVWQVRHYEEPTVASRMKRAAAHGCVPRRRLPFVVSASTTPSHNLAVNLQKLLNSLKIQQPPRGIPLTLAHHLGLKNLSNYVSNSALLARGAVSEGGASAGRSYVRALTALRAGDGPLPRYLRSLHMFSKRSEVVEDWDISDCATVEAKRKLAEYAQLYRELERVDERLGVRLDKRHGERRDPALELRRRQLVAQLRAREGKVSDIVREYEEEGESAASARPSPAGRHSQYTLNVG